MRTLAIILALAAPAAAQDNKKDEYASKMSNLRVSLDFKDAPLDSIIDYLREIADMNIFLDQKVREKQLTLSIKVTEISLKSVLSLMLKPHGCDTMFKDGVLMVMTKEDIADRLTRMEIYDCRDILYPVQDFPGVDISLAQDQIGVNVVSDGGGEGNAFPIEELVKAHTGGRSWEENPKAACSMQNGLLIIKNTPEVHKQVRRLLDMLRAHK
jgi:type II secretory pathway component GspD/PulD (secretin)